MNKICIIVCAVSTQKDYILWWGLSVEPLSKNWPRFSAQQKLPENAALLEMRH